MSNKILRGFPVGVIPRGGTILRYPGMSYQQRVLALNPIAYWPLNEPAGTSGAGSVLDASGNGMNGTPTSITFGAAGYSSVDTAATIAAAASGINVYSAGLATAWNGSTGSLSFMFRTSNWPFGALRVAAKFGADANNYVQMISNPATFQMDATFARGGVLSAISIKIADYHYHHFCVTWNATTVKFYLDGHQIGSDLSNAGTWSGTLAATGANIGSNTSAGDFPWNADDQHVALFTTELSGTNVTSLSDTLATCNALFFGDSITYGSSASDRAHQFAELIAADHGWARIVNSGFSATILQNTTQTTVATIGGAALLNGRDTYANRTLLYGATRVFILYGLNDLRLNDAAITSANFENDLGEVVDALVADGITAQNIIIGSPPYIPEASYALNAPYNGGSRIKHAAYTASCAAVATAKGTRYADVYQYMTDNGGDSLVSVDGIHPNDSGHAAIAACFLAALA